MKTGQPLHRLKLFHGTAWEKAQKIKRDGFEPSSCGCLGPGIYIAREAKARRFASDRDRHGGESGGLVTVLIDTDNPKFIDGDDRMGAWQIEGHDACRTGETSASTNMEWCVRSNKQVTVLHIEHIPLPGLSHRHLDVGQVDETMFILDKTGDQSLAADLGDNNHNPEFDNVQLDGAMAGPRRLHRDKARGGIRLLNLRPTGAASIAVPEGEAQETRDWQNMSLGDIAGRRRKTRVKTRVSTASSGDSSRRSAASSFGAQRLPPQRRRVRGKHRLRDPQVSAEVQAEFQAEL